jgi:hypothetical protein
MPIAVSHYAVASDVTYTLGASDTVYALGAAGDYAAAPRTVQPVYTLGTAGSSPVGTRRRGPGGSMATYDVGRDGADLYDNMNKDLYAPLDEHYADIDTAYTLGASATGLPATGRAPGSDGLYAVADTVSQPVRPKGARGAARSEPVYALGSEAAVVLPGAAEPSQGDLYAVADAVSARVGGPRQLNVTGPAGSDLYAVADATV